MVGLGGGFILVPILRVFFGIAPAEAAGTSLVLVLASSASGALTFLLKKKIHLRIGWLLAAGGLPGGILGAFLSARIPARLFDWILAAILIAVAADLFINARRRMEGRPEHEHVHRIKGMSYRAALALGFAVGLISSLFGLGGGILLVPSLFYFSELPVHAVGATSQFGILLTSPVGLVVHLLQSDVIFADAIPLVLGGLLGGPLGARLSLRFKSPQLLAIVGVALVVVAGSLFVKHL